MPLGLPGQLRHPPQGWPRRFIWHQASAHLPGGDNGRVSGAGPAALRILNIGPGLVSPEFPPWPRFRLPTSGARRSHTGTGPVSPPDLGPSRRRKSLGQGLGVLGWGLWLPGLVLRVD